MLEIAVLDENSVTVETIVPFNPSTEVIDIFAEKLVFAWSRQMSSKTFLDLTLKLIQPHVINCVLETKAS